MLQSLSELVIPWWKTQNNLQLLQDGASPDLCLAHPTPGECEAISRMSFVEWGDALTLDEYLEESEFLQTVPLAKDNGMLTWILTDGSPPDYRPILCSCETFFKSALIANSKHDCGEGIVHGIASLFCDPALRRRGFAARLLRELVRTLPHLCLQSKRPLACVLYSDIGTKYYRNLGWHTAPDNVHVKFDAIPASGDLLAKPLREEDLAQLCKDDEAIVRRAILEDVNGKRRLTVVPDIEHMLWHQSKENFACSKLFGESPEIKGAVAGEPGHRVWAIWTHRYYGAPDPASSDNTLYILRLVVENPRRDHDQEEEDPQVDSLNAVIEAAQNEATCWRLPCVKLWSPTPSIRKLIAKTKISFTTEERETDSAAMIMWFDSERGESRSVCEWMGNEKYAWC